MWKKRVQLFFIVSCMQCFCSYQQLQKLKYLPFVNFQNFKWVMFVLPGSKCGILNMYLFRNYRYLVCLLGNLRYLYICKTFIVEFLSLNRYNHYGIPRLRFLKIKTIPIRKYLTITVQRDQQSLLLNLQQMTLLNIHS